MEGFIAIHRKIILWEWYHDSNMVHLFLHLLLVANHQDGNYKGTQIKRGQILTGRYKLKKETGLSEQTIRSCLTKLKSTNEITIHSTNKNSLITICKYNSYATEKRNINHLANHLANQQSTNNQPTTNQQLTTNNNVYNDNNSLNTVLINEKNSKKNGTAGYQQFDNSQSPRETIWASRIIKPAPKD